MTDLRRVADRVEIRAAVERMQGLWEFFVQTVHPGVVRLDGDTATGRAYVAEFGRMRDGSSHQNHAVYHDRYQRTPDGWKFTGRVYEVTYLDNTPLAGSTPRTIAEVRARIAADMEPTA
ncbi:nuclear transport factor 2 family protein [Streptomyces sp. NPDC059002]|uniref:nuclear transport factor 2 family protein n=1 Tax=Streptomyces sp. NPDC059002 TaxID=3346690 RepID=UPI0036CB65B2